MATDPYHAVQQEIQSTLDEAAQLRDSYVRIRSTAREDSEELKYAAKELKTALGLLEIDLGDLDESVKMVESTDPRYFGIDHNEVQRRRRYVGEVHKRIENMKAELKAAPSQSSRAAIASPPSRSGNATPKGRDSEDNDERAWARQEQQMIMQEQDRNLDSLVGTLSTLAQQAGLIGQEVGEHNELLDDLERGVDHTDSKLNSAMGKLKNFARKSEEKGSGWCILILIIILGILLLAVILI